MPEEFTLPRPTTQVFIPWDIVPSFAGFEEGPPRDYRFLNVLARLRAGVGATEAQAEMQALAATLAAAHPRANAGWSVRLVPLREELLATARPVLSLLGAAVGLVLLLGCANVAGLQLARATGRRREMAVRLSLGASRRRLLRQLLTESALLAFLGGGLGLLVARLAQSLILAQAPAGLPGLEGAGLDPRALAFAAGLSVLTAILFGLVPALEASRVPLAGALHDGGRSATQGPRVRRLRRLLVAFEVAAALVLLAGAGLLGRSLLRVLAVDTGFDPRGLVSLRVSLDHATYKTGAHSREFYRALLPRLAALPGAAGAGAVTALPLHPVGTDFARPYWREGEPDPGGNAARADIRMATPGYFHALRMTLRRGRGLTDADDERAPRVIVVNETLARQAFATDDPVGRRLVLDYMGGSYPYEIVGIVGDVRFGSVKAAPRPEIFIPHAQNPYLDLTVVVRAKGDASSMVARVRQEIAAIDPRQPAHAVATMDELVRRSIAADRFLAALLIALAGLALVLAATGLNGLLAYLVGQRTQELGLRQALGATPGQVIGLVMGESLRLVLAGCATGLLLALALLPRFSVLLYEVGPSDVWAWAAAMGLLLTTAVVASLIPARAASRVDPLSALRAE
jgi:putative ABC transport system permease protein